MPDKISISKNTELIQLDDIVTLSRASSVTVSVSVSVTSYTSSEEEEDEKPVKICCFLRETLEHSAACFLFILVAGVVCAGMVFYQETNNPCMKYPCLNNGTCQRTPGNQYKCVCPEGLYGKLCEHWYNECHSNPCMNNGTCIDGVYKWICECLSGWHGPACEHRVTPCISNPCYNNAECVAVYGTFNCTCPFNFTGHQCETNITASG